MVGFYGDFENDKDVFPDLAGRSTVIPFSSKTPILCGVAPPGFKKIAETCHRFKTLGQSRPMSGKAKNELLGQNTLLGYSQHLASGLRRSALFHQQGVQLTSLDPKRNVTMRGAQITF